MTNQHVGSSFDDFLDEVGIANEVRTYSTKRMIAIQIKEFMESDKITKTAMAKKMDTSRSQIERLLDPTAADVRLSTMERAANVLGKKLMIDLV
mgnify:CR=1 FL=1